MNLDVVIPFIILNVIMVLGGVVIMAISNAQTDKLVKKYRK